MRLKYPDVMRNMMMDSNVFEVWFGHRILERCYKECNPDMDTPRDRQWELVLAGLRKSNMFKRFVISSRYPGVYRSDIYYGYELRREFRRG